MRPRFALVALPLLLAACGNAESPAGSGASGGEAASYAGPLTSSDVALGEVAYRTNCEDCHPGGGRGRGPRISDAALSPERMRRQIREGQGRMPAFTPQDLDATQLEALLAYLARMGAVHAEPNAVPPSPPTATP
ncbi:MAG: cytochrome c [Polyangiales bacterium]